MFKSPLIACGALARRTFHTSVRRQNVTSLQYGAGRWPKITQTGLIQSHVINHQQIRFESSSSSPVTNWKKLTNEEWAERLSPEAYFCTREGGTEPPFSGQYLNHKAEGIYKCVCCGSDLFTSKSKYDSQSGWPSFHTPAEETRVVKRKDISHGMVRVEILCANCHSHLGHVFDDGPEPTGQRYCVNSVCLKFSPKKIN